VSRLGRYVQQYFVEIGAVVSSVMPAGCHITSRDPLCKCDITRSNGEVSQHILTLTLTHASNRLMHVFLVHNSSTLDIFVNPNPNLHLDLWPWRSVLCELWPWPQVKGENRVEITARCQMDKRCHILTATHSLLTQAAKTTTPRLLTAST